MVPGTVMHPRSISVTANTARALYSCCLRHIQVRGTTKSEYCAERVKRLHQRAAFSVLDLIRRSTLLRRQQKYHRPLETCWTQWHRSSETCQYAVDQKRHFSDYLGANKHFLRPPRRLIKPHKYRINWAVTNSRPFNINSAQNVRTMNAHYHLWTVRESNLILCILGTVLAAEEPLCMLSV